MGSASNKTRLRKRYTGYCLRRPGHLRYGYIQELSPMYYASSSEERPTLSCADQRGARKFKRLRDVVPVAVHLALAVGERYEIIRLYRRVP